MTVPPPSSRAAWGEPPDPDLVRTHAPVAESSEPRTLGGQDPVNTGRSTTGPLGVDLPPNPSVGTPFETKTQTLQQGSKLPGTRPNLQVHFELPPTFSRLRTATIAYGMCVAEGQSNSPRSTSSFAYAHHPTPLRERPRTTQTVRLGCTTYTTCHRRKPSPRTGPGEHFPPPVRDWTVLPISQPWSSTGPRESRAR